MPEPTYVSAGASFDEARIYRYRLWRVWDPSLPVVLFVMLNPSTADENVLDPTLRRCLGYAQRWGCGGFEVANLFALRSTDPAALYTHPDPVGPLNDALTAYAAGVARWGVVAGWGAHGSLHGRDRVVAQLPGLAGRLTALRTTKGGAPGHPLYLPAALNPRPWQPSEVRT